MGAVVYSFSVSLDGFVADPDGGIDWGATDDELLRFHSEQARALGVQILGRRLYETMLYWETVDASTLPPAEAEWAEVWLPLLKVVFSSRLESVQGNATLRRDGLVEEVLRLKRAEEKDIAVGGAGVASSLIAAGLVDEYRLFVQPVVLGGGTPYFPALKTRIGLELMETRGFAGGVEYLRYRAT
jgi:dihydrofolate reductase